MEQVSEQDLVRVAELLGIPVSTAKKTLPKEVVVPTEFRIVRVNATCLLCQTETKQYVKLGKYGAALWQKIEPDPTAVEIYEATCLDKLEIYTVGIRACWNCEKVLLTWEKEALVNLVLAHYTTISNKSDVWERVKEYRRCRRGK